MMQNDVGTNLPLAAAQSLPPPSHSKNAGGLPSHSTGAVGGQNGAQDVNNAAKAAIVVRLLLNEGADLPLEQLPEALQVKLTEQMGKMGLVDRKTLSKVVREFAEKVDGVGLHFPHGLHAAIEALNGRISENTAEKLRKMAGLPQTTDPWGRLRDLEEDGLVDIMQSESVEIAAVLLSKLETEKAARILTQLPGPLARRITHAVSLTRNVSPDAVRRIGQSLVEQFETRPETAFDIGPDQRLGAILNRTSAAVRNEVLSALSEVDKPFGAAVQRHIFTFEHIPARLATTDVPKVVRAADQVVFATVLAGAEPAGCGEAAEFLLANLSSRMADTLREEAEELGAVQPEDAEDAMAKFVDIIVNLAESGEIALAIPDAENAD